jgi:hypothetical protein
MSATVFNTIIAGLGHLQTGSNMHFIHPIKKDETPIDHGIYVYYRNGVRLGVIEPWQCHSKPDGTVITRVERDATVFGNKMHCYTEEINNQFTVIELRWQSTTDTNQFVHAIYELLGDSAVFKHKTPLGSTTQTIELNGAMPLPLMRVFYGRVLEQTVAKGGMATVLVPWIQDPNQQDKFFTPHFSERTARVLINQDIQIIDGTEQLTTQYEYIGDQYQAGSQFWVNEKHLLARYRWQQSEDQAWDTVLENYRSV